MHPKDGHEGLHTQIDSEQRIISKIFELENTKKILRGFFSKCQFTSLKNFHVILIFKSILERWRRPFGK